VAEVEEVEAILDRLLTQLGEVDDQARSVMPSERLLRASCPDLDLVRYASWRTGQLTLLDDAPSRRADIRISVRSDDLVKLTSGTLTFGQAYLSGRIRIDASMSDLLRLRAAL